MLKLKACQDSGGLEPNWQTISKKKSELSSRALEAKPGQQSGNGRKDGTLRKKKKEKHRHFKSTGNGWLTKNR